MKAHRCPGPLPFERVVAYCLGELDRTDAEAVEERLFACDACADAAIRCEALMRALGDYIPPVVSPSNLHRLTSLGDRIVVTHVRPEEPATVLFARGLDYLVHHLELPVVPEANERVDLAIESEDGQPMSWFEHVPLDRAQGRVSIACRRHYVEQWPHNVRFRLSGVSEAGARPLAQFVVRHVVER